MTNPMILVPVDDSAHALIALPVARTLALLEGAVIHILHICERARSPQELSEVLALPPRLLQDSVVDQRTGDPAQEILRFATERPTAAIVMCTRAGVAAIGTHLSPVAERVLTDAGCPVIMVRPERGNAPWELRRVLLPHDATPTTSACICSAVELARKAKARLSVLHVVAPDAQPPQEPGSLPAPHYTDQRQHEWPSWGVEFLERMVGLCGTSIDPSSLHLAVARGTPEREVVRFAVEHEVDLIVVAWRGALEEKHAEVIKAVLREAPCPVMVVRAHA